MRRSDRLAEIVEIIRDGKLHHARDLAETLGVSERTIYRDMGTLVASGVPVEGERGVGYMMRAPAFLPPLALSTNELEALFLGMTIVRQIADPELRLASDGLLQKVEGSASLRRRTRSSWGFRVYVSDEVKNPSVHMPLVRQAIIAKRKLKVQYLSLAGEQTTRTIRPLQVEYWRRVWTCAAWCELRSEFRALRVDGIVSCTQTDDRFSDEPGKEYSDYVSSAIRDKEFGGRSRNSTVQFHDSRSEKV